MLAFVVILVLLALPGAVASAEARPNILVVMTDDQAAEGTLEIMPSTRKLVGARGITFRDAHATTPMCCPSRASFFTGRYVHNHGVNHNQAANNLRSRQTVQYFLKRRGYRTALFGKYLNGWPLGKNPPHFHEWATSTTEFQGADWNWGGRIFRDVPLYNTDAISNYAVHFIKRADRRDKRPWLMWLTPLAPHYPSEPAPRHRDAPLPKPPETPALTEADITDKPDFLEPARTLDHEIETVRDDGRRSLLSVDEMVARLVRQLGRRKELKNTLIVFTSDNGVMLGEHGGVGGKDLPYRASTQIPMLVRWDKRVRAGTVRRDLVSNVDVGTTILDVAGVKRKTDGKSLFSKRRRKMLFLEHFGVESLNGSAKLPPWRALRTADFRYAEYYGANGRVTTREYYDLRADPWELENRAAMLSAGRLAELSATAVRLGTCKNRSCP